VISPCHQPRWPSRPLAVAATAICVVGSLAACSGDTNEAAGGVQPSLAPSSGTATGGGHRDLRTAAAAVESGERARVSSALALPKRPCIATEPAGNGDGPRCPAGVSVGTQVPSLSVGSCGGYWVAGAEIAREIALVGGPPGALRLFGVFRDQSNQLIGLYIPADGDVVTLTAYFSDAGILGFGWPCGKPRVPQLPDGAVWIIGGDP
jgi:hypothetical protein